MTVFRLQFSLEGTRKTIDREDRMVTENQFDRDFPVLEQNEVEPIGFNSSFDGPASVNRYKRELDAFLKHTLAQKYNGKAAPQLALVSPNAMQDLSAKYGIPGGEIQNANLALYTGAMAEVAAENGVLFVDAFKPSKTWFTDGKEYTTDGALLNDAGYRRLAPMLADAIFGTAGIDSKNRGCCSGDR